MATIKILKWQEGKNLQELTREQIFDAIQKIDHAVFHENVLATKESDIAWYEAFTDSYIFALAENKIVGYICYFPITKDFYQLVIKGEDVYDGNIAPTDICVKFVCDKYVNTKRRSKTFQNAEKSGTIRHG